MRLSERDKGHTTNAVQTYFLVVFDFIFRDDAVGLVGLLPGELDAALLHFLLDDLADLGRSCLDKSMSISGGQTLPARTRIRPATNWPQRLLHRAPSGPRKLTKYSRGRFDMFAPHD